MLPVTDKIIVIANTSNYKIKNPKKDLQKFYSI